MTIKDSLDTAGVISTGGTKGRAALVPEQDATVVAHGYALPALFTGKTNTPELTLSERPTTRLRAHQQPVRCVAHSRREQWRGRSDSASVARHWILAVTLAAVFVYQPTSVALLASSPPLGGYPEPGMSCHLVWVQWMR